MLHCLLVCLQSTLMCSINFDSINVSVRRIGGGYGGKITRQHVVSSAAAVASRKLRCPVRIVVDLNTHMSLVGWREPYLSKYEVRFCGNGISYLEWLILYSGSLCIW